MTTKYKYRIGNCPDCDKGYDQTMSFTAICHLCGRNDPEIPQPKLKFSPEEEERMRKWKADNDAANARIADGSATVVAMRERNDNSE